MFKIILKNLWARRRRNAALLIELIIITVVAWAALDTMVVNLYVRNMPLGYDPDRLVAVEFGHVFINPDEENDSVRDAAMHRYASIVADFPEVETAVRVPGPLMLESTSYSCSTMSPDTVNYYHLFSYPIKPGWNMFDAIGIKSVGRSPSTEELVTRTYAQGEIVLSESAARVLFGDKDPVGHYIGEDGPGFDEEDASKVVGVVSDVRTRSNESDAMVYYYPQKWPQYDTAPIMLIRLKDGVSGREFINKYRDTVMRDFKGSANIYAYKFRTMPDISEEYLYKSGQTNSMRLRLVLAVFLLVNLLLGMAGIFMLQTRKRSEDAGIMLSFGSTPGRIRRMLLAEGAVLTTAAWAIGCMIYLKVAESVGLARGTGNMNVDMRMDVPWIASFGEHFAIVSLIVYVLVLAAVLAGICIPAWRISRVNPVDALRDE